MSARTRLRPEDDESAPAPGAFLLEGGAWVVESGRLDVFLVRLRDGQPHGPRTHLVRVETGQAAFGLERRHAARGDLLTLQAVGDPRTRVRRIDPAAPATDGDEDGTAAAMARLAGGWIAALGDSVASNLRSKRSVEVRAGTRLDVETGATVHAGDQPVWVRYVTGSGWFLGQQDLVVAGAAPFPLASRGWLHAGEPGTLEVSSTADVVAQDALSAGLAAFHAHVLGAACAMIARATDAERVRLTRKDAARRSTLRAALSQIVSILDRRTPARAGAEGTAGELPADDALLLACRLVGDAVGVTIRTPPADDGARDPVARIARASRIRIRRVILRDDWWRRDNGPLLGSIADDDRPVALIPRSSTSYELCDTRRGVRTPLTAAVAATLAPFAFAFYRPLPVRAVGAADVMRFALRGSKRDVWAVLVAAAAGAALALIPPLATGMLFNSIVPGAQREQLWHMTLLLLVCALAAALFQVAWSIALMRIDGRAGGMLQAAVWDRLLSLPTSFFRQYSAGDLAARAMSVDLMRQLLTGPALAAILAGPLSLLNVGLLFFFSSTLARWALALIAVGAAAVALVAYRQLAVQRVASPVRTKASGVVLQLLTGVSKLRVAGAEIHGFAMWAELFSRQRALQFRIRTSGNWFAVFRSVFPGLCAMVLFALVLYYTATGTPIRAGDFVAFLAAFTGCVTAMLGVGSVAMSAAGLVPLYELTAPILQAVPEVDETKTDPGVLTGAIDIDHLVFRYAPDAAAILNDVSVAIRPGEFVAVVGPSGSGKSTLLRLLLGFESPESGGIRYDGQDLGGLDLRAVRRQIGVVLQSSRLMTGDMYSTIVGSSNATLDDAWEAARMAGLDEDIRQMAMGMHTVVSQGGATLSGGQRQRLLIARAIVERPRILFFDEATSALDNRTQATVSNSLRQLQATRLVIAHRLSTIVGADRIVVMERGRIVQVGTYEALLADDGLFAALARRQVV